MREIGDLTQAEALADVTEADRERLIEILSKMKSNLLNDTEAPAGERKVRHG